MSSLATVGGLHLRPSFPLCRRTFRVWRGRRGQSSGRAYSSPSSPPRLPDLYDSGLDKLASADSEPRYEEWCGGAGAPPSDRSARYCVVAANLRADDSQFTCDH